MAPIDDPVIEVALAVIWRWRVDRGALGEGSGVEILLTRRPDDAHLGGWWEYPGGKVEPHETVEEAVRREVREETGLIIEAIVPLASVEHAYPDRRVRLHAFLMEAATEAIVAPQGISEWRWTTPAEFARFDLPQANGPITAAALAAIERTQLTPIDKMGKIGPKL